MNPNLQYSQAIHGRVTGRGIGVIDTIHLVEVARAIPYLRETSVLSDTEHDRLEKWFAGYLDWMTHSSNGVEEREAKNNHGTCWVMQAAQFAQYTGNQQVIEYCRDRYETVLLPNQAAPDGSFPLELGRTKPYSYCLFNLDAMATICQILSSPHDDVWRFSLADGRSMQTAMAFMFPFIADKHNWPHPADVQYFDQFPVRQPSLLFAGLAYSEPRYLSLWSKLDPDPTLDVDLGLGDGEYATLVKALMSHGYEQRKELRRFQLVRKVQSGGGGAIDVIVDFLMPRDAEIMRNVPPLISEFAVQRADGAELAVRFYQMVAIAGNMPSGGVNRVEIAVCSIPALLAMKGHAVNGRYKQKDSYDIYYCIRNYPDGIERLAEACRPLLEHASAARGFGFVAEKFVRALGSRG